MCLFLSRGNSCEVMKCIAKAADSICDGELVEKQIRASSRWELLPLQVEWCVDIHKSSCTHTHSHSHTPTHLPTHSHLHTLTQAYLSSVIPGTFMQGFFGKPMFPQWLGNNSKRGKCDRMLQELQRHTRLAYVAAA